MWNTDCWSPHFESLKPHLCPHCDSLGPHRAVTDELPSDAFLECIDCGAVLGWLTPQGIEPMSHDRPAVPEVAEQGREVEKAGVHYPESISDALQITAVMGLLLKTRR